jgi:CheY-like chemotaxis protein
MYDGTNAIAYRQELLPPNPAYAADNDNLLNILLVEDDYNDSLLTIQTVNATRVPYNLDRITHGDDVMPYLKNCMQSHLPDILFLDMGLPGMNGFEILETLARSPAAMRAIPIAIITGHTHFDYLPKTFALPIYGYLTKPIRLENIRPILSKVTDFRK